MTFPFEEMKMGKYTKEIAAYRLAHPEASYAEIAAAVGCKVGSIGNILGQLGMTKKRKRFKKRKAPVQQVMNLEVKQETVVPPAAVEKTLSTEAKDIYRLNVEIFTLRQQIAGYVAVISYLEHKLGLKEDGATV
jgi:uncharacterized protein YfcZ (UPF0381/DUF406 family)